MSVSEKIELKNIPPEFVLKNLTPYQITSIKNKFYIMRRVAELKKTDSNLFLADIYEIIADEIFLSSETIKRIYITTLDNLILKKV
jgi:hypothetical protein